MDPNFFIRGIEDENLDGEGLKVLSKIKDRRGESGLLNLDRMLLHSPPLASGWNEFMGSIRSKTTSVPPNIRELVICYVAILNEAPYEWQQHAPLFSQYDDDPMKLEALKGLSAKEGSEFLTIQEFPLCFLDFERDVLLFTLQITRSCRCDPQLRFKIIQATSMRSFIELTLIISSYNMVSRFLNSTSIQLE